MLNGGYGLLFGKHHYSNLESSYQELWKNSYLWEAEEKHFHHHNERNVANALFVRHLKIKKLVLKNLIVVNDNLCKGPKLPIIHLVGHWRLPDVFEQLFVHFVCSAGFPQLHLIRILKDHRKVIWLFFYRLELQLLRLVVSHIFMRFHFFQHLALRFLQGFLLFKVTFFRGCFGIPWSFLMFLEV